MKQCIWLRNGNGTIGLDKMKTVFRFLLFFFLLLVLPACTAKVTETPTPVPTAPLPTRIVATLEPKPTEAGCLDSFYFLGDVNYPDGTVVEAGTAFLKAWEVQNAGTCDWNEKYRLRFVSGVQMSAPDYVSIPSVSAGNKGKFSVEFKAPKEPGTYRSTWKAFGSNNRSFGEVLYVEIVVQ